MDNGCPALFLATIPKPYPIKKPPGATNTQRLHIDKLTPKDNLTQQLRLYHFRGRLGKYTLEVFFYGIHQKAR